MFVGSASKRRRTSPRGSDQHLRDQNSIKTILDNDRKSPTSRARSDVEKPSASESPQVGDEQAETVQYTRTGRISKAKKGRRVHYCDCGRSYARAEHLRRHQKNHAQDALVCEFPGCGKTFYRIDLLQRHQERHNEVEEDDQARRERAPSPTRYAVLRPSEIYDDIWRAPTPSYSITPNDSVASGDSGYASITSPLLQSAPSQSHIFSSTPVDVDGLGTGLSWKDPFIVSQAPNYSTSSGYASPAPDYANMFANPPYGSNAIRARTSSDVSFIEPWAFSSATPTAAPSKMSYTWKSSDQKDFPLFPNLQAHEILFPEPSSQSLEPSFLGEIVSDTGKQERSITEVSTREEIKIKRDGGSTRLCIKPKDDAKKKMDPTEKTLAKVVSVKEEGHLKDMQATANKHNEVAGQAPSRFTLRSKTRALKHSFTPEEGQLLVILKEQKGLAWEQIADFFPGRSSNDLYDRYLEEKLESLSGSQSSPQDTASKTVDTIICPLKNHDGSNCRKRCTGWKRYQLIQEHIRRAHPENYVPKLPPTQESFSLMTKVIDHSTADLNIQQKTLLKMRSPERFQSPDNQGRNMPPPHGMEQALHVSAKDYSHPGDTARCVEAGYAAATSADADEMISDAESSYLGSSTDESDLSSPSTSSSIHSLVISTRSRMIDALMRQLHISIRDLSIAPVACAADGSSHTASSESFNSTSTKNTSETARGKRKIGDDGGDAPDEGDDDKSNKRRRPNDKNMQCDGDQPIRYACPFFKRNPRAHRRTACRYPGFTSVHRMKEHLYRDHIHVHCHRCNILFKSDEDLREHQRGEPCIVSDREPPEGISTTQLARLKSKKRFGKERTEEEKWRAIYQYLFPDEDASLVSPYCDDWVDGEDDGNQLTDYELFCRREFTRRVRRELDALLEQRAQPLEDDLRAELVGVVQRCRDSLYSDFERQNRMPASASQPSGSAARPSIVPPPQQSQEMSQQPPSSLPTLDSGSDSDQLPNSLSPHSSSELNHAGGSFGPPSTFPFSEDFGQQFGSVDFDMSQYGPDAMFAGPIDSGDLFMSTVLQKDADANVLQYMNGAHQFNGPWDGTSFPHN